MQNESELRQEICDIGARLYQQHYIVGMDGNLSIRLPGNIILCTPSGICKGELTPDEIIKIDITGQKISGAGKASSEVAMHLVAYRERSDVRAVLHAHPLVTVSLTVAGKRLDKILLPEVAYYLGRIATAPYATPGSETLANSIRPFLSECDAIVLERHGILAVGKTLWEAFYKLEYVEYAAQVAWRAEQLGALIPLDGQEIEKIQSLRQKLRKISEG